MRETASGLILAQGIPDSGLADAFVNKDGRPEIRLPNQHRLPPQTVELFDLRKQRFWFPSVPLIPARGLRGVINLCVDPWGYRKALASLGQWCANKVPVFNHPAAIVRATQTGFLSEVARVSGLDAPKRASFVARKPDDFRQVHQKAGLRYPVRIDAASSRAVAPDLLIKSERQWDKVESLAWPGRTFVMAEVLPDHLLPHRRWRISFAGREAELVSYHYAVGGQDASGEAKQDNDVALTEIRRACGIILGAVGMDHWTADLSQGQRGQLRLDHLWAGLPDWPENAASDPSFRLWGRLAPKLHKLILTPDQWRAVPSAKAKVGP